MPPVSLPFCPWGRSFDADTFIFPVIGCTDEWVGIEVSWPVGFLRDRELADPRFAFQGTEYNPRDNTDFPSNMPIPSKGITPKMLSVP